MKRFIIIFFTLNILVVRSALAQTVPFSDSGNYLKLNREYIVTCVTDTRDVLVSPVLWHKKQWLGFVAFAGASAILYSQDKDVRDFFQRNRSQATDEISKYGLEPWGSGFYLFPLIGGMYIYGLAGRHQEAETASLLTGKAMLISGGFTVFFKGITQRHRPNQDLPSNPALWEGPFGGFKFVSYPSGHTALAFSAATMLSSYFHEKTWLVVTSYAFATLVGISRLNDDKHWASDVLGGAALGYAIGKLVYKNYDKKNNFTFIPYLDGPFQGVSVNYCVK